MLKYPDAYVQALVEQYKPLLDERRQVNPLQPMTMQKPAATLIKLMKETGVTVTQNEATTILKQVSQNKEKVYGSMGNVLKAIVEFKRVTN